MKKKNQEYYKMKVKRNPSLACDSEVRIIDIPDLEVKASVCI